VGNILGIVNQILLGRFLGPEDYGLFNLALSVVMIASVIAIFGLFGALSRFIPYYLKRDEKETVKSLIDFSSLFVFSVSILLATLLYIFSRKIATTIFHDEDLATVLKVFSIGIPIFALQRVMMAVVRGFKAAKHDALIFKIGDRLVRIFVFLLFLTIGYRLYGALFAFLSGCSVSIIVSGWLIKNKIFPDYHKYKRVPVAKTLLSFSWPLALTGFTFIFVSKTSTLLVGYFLTSADVGVYTPTLVIAKLLFFVSAAFQYIFLPVVSESFSKNKLKDIESLFKSTFKWTFLIVLPLFLLISLFPREILTLLYGNEYSGGYLALIVLCFGTSINAFSGTPGNILVGGGHTKLNLACEIIAAATTISLSLTLIPTYGIVGAAIAMGVSYFVRTTSFLYFVYKKFGIHPYKHKYLKIGFSCLAVTSIIYVLKIYSPFTWWITMLVLGAIFLILYTITVMFSKSFDENDMVILEAVERKLGIKLDFIKNIISKT